MQKLKVKKKEKNNFSGEIAFENYYSQCFAQRWSALKESFFIENLYFELDCGSTEKYFLDSASVLSASCLPLENATNILDLCAAPGGKTLVLATRMNENAKLISNERSAERRNRLISVIKSCLSSDIANRISVTGFDGTLACKKFDTKFDSILLDAPCSSERHVLQNPKYLSQWTKSRIKNLSYTQWALLSSAFLTLNDEGFLLYSTCAISTDENDGVIEKLLKKYCNCQCIELDFTKIYEKLPSNLKIPKLKVEKTKFGYQILPDVNKGAGPIFFCLIQKHKCDKITDK